AQEFADDLRRFLEDRPIKARRPTPLQSLRRWLRRHRGLVVTAGVGAAPGGGGFPGRGRRGGPRPGGPPARRGAGPGPGGARGGGPRLRDRRSWVEAREVVKRAEWLLADGGREAERQRLRAIVADLDMVARLEEIRLQPWAGWDRKEVDQAYADAFRDYG